MKLRVSTYVLHTDILAEGCALQNTTGVIGPSQWCSSSSLNYKLNVNMNDTFITNFVGGQFLPYWHPLTRIAADHIG